MKARTLAGMTFATLLLLAAPLFAETPKECVGFWGTVTGVVKSARDDGTSFVLTISNAVPGEQSLVTDGGPMVGKVITLGTRMPKKDGQAAPREEDVAYIKTLKAGDNITVPIFATKADPTVLRIKEPGHPAATEPAHTDGGKRD